MTARALIIRGHQGTGKTTVAKELLKVDGTCLLSKDDLYLPALAEIGEHHSASRVAYDAILAVIRANRQSSITFVVDAPFHEEADVNNFINTCEEFAVVARSVLLVCRDNDVWDARLSKRKGEPSPNHLITSLVELAANRPALESWQIQGEIIFDTALANNTADVIAAAIYTQILTVD